MKKTFKSYTEFRKDLNNRVYRRDHSKKHAYSRVFKNLGRAYIKQYYDRKAIISPFACGKYTGVEDLKVKIKEKVGRGYTKALKIYDEAWSSYGFQAKKTTGYSLDPLADRLTASKGKENRRPRRSKRLVGRVKQAPAQARNTPVQTPRGEKRGGEKQIDLTPPYPTGGFNPMSGMFPRNGGFGRVPFFASPPLIPPHNLQTGGQVVQTVTAPRPGPVNGGGNNPFGFDFTLNQGDEQRNIVVPPPPRPESDVATTGSDVDATDSIGPDEEWNIGDDLLKIGDGSGEREGVYRSRVNSSYDTLGRIGREDEEEDIIGAGPNFEF